MLCWPDVYRVGRLVPYQEALPTPEIPDVSTQAFGAAGFKYRLRIG